MSRLFGSPKVFEPCGVGVKPLFRISPVEIYTSGRPHIDYYKIDWEGGDIECRTWADVRRYFDGLGFGVEFDKRFPGPEMLPLA
jgi:hypothetical protein